jgi:formylglycine-generating enzyme
VVVKGKDQLKDLYDADGQVHGTAPSASKSMPAPFGMAYIPPGTFHMGPSDEDINYNLNQRNRQVSIPGFWMDRTEITNNKYRSFVWWVRDSMASKELGYIKKGGPSAAGDSNVAIDWTKRPQLKYDSKQNEKLGDKLVLAPDNRFVW